MAGVFEHYRISSLGQELKECLDDLIEAEELDEKQYGIIFKHFDNAICCALANNVQTKAVIHGPLHHYRNHDDIWTFVLNSIEVKIDKNLTLRSSERTNILSVTKR